MAKASRLLWSRQPGESWRQRVLQFPQETLLSLKITNAIHQSDLSRMDVKSNALCKACQTRVQKIRCEPGNLMVWIHSWIYTHERSQPPTSNSSPVSSNSYQARHLKRPMKPILAHWSHCLEAKCPKLTIRKQAYSMLVYSTGCSYIIHLSCS